MPSICLLDQTPEFSGQPAPTTSTTTTPPPLSVHLSWCLLPIGPLQRLMLYTFTPRGPGETHGPKKEKKKQSGRKKAPLGGRGLQPITSAGPLSSGARSVLIVHVPPYQTSQSIQRCTAGFIVFCIVSSPPCTGKKKKIQNSLSLPLFFFFTSIFF